MARIGLTQAQGGIRPTDKPLPQTPSANLSGKMAGINAIRRGANVLANGIAHVAQTVDGISADMAEARNRIEINSALIGLKSSEAALEADYERRLQAGEFKTFDEAKNAFLSDYRLKIEDPSAKAFQEKGLAPNVRDALNANMKASCAGSLARFGGAWMRSENKRLADTVLGDVNACVEAGDIDGIGKCIEPMRGSYWSPELCDKIREKSIKQVYENKLNLFTLQIRQISDPEQLERKLDEVFNSDAYKKSPELNRENFNVFAFAQKGALARATRAEAERAYSEKRKTSELDLRGLSANVELAAMENMSLVKSVHDLEKYAIDEKAIDADVEKILTESNFSDAEKSIWRKQIKETVADTQVSFRKGVLAKLKTQAFDVLKNAVEENDGFIPSDIIKDDKLSAARREAENIGNYEDLESDPSYLETLLSKEEKEKYDNMTPHNKKILLSAIRSRAKARFSERFFSVVMRIGRYDSNTDEDGQKLVSLMRDAQVFPKERRSQLMQLIYDTAYSIKPNEKWSSEDVKEFNAEFDVVIKEDGNLGYDPWFGDDGDPIAALDMRRRVLNAAKVRGLSLNEAIKEMKEDPFYKEVFQKRNRQKALEFINNR